MRKRAWQALQTLGRMQTEGAQNDVLIPYLLSTGYMWALQDFDLKVPTDDEVAALITMISEGLMGSTQDNPN